MRPPRRKAAFAAPAGTDPGEAIALADGRHLRLRPIRIDDTPALQRAFLQLTPDEVRMRFLHAMNALPDDLAARLCDLDAERAFALVLIDEVQPTPAIHAVARIAIDVVTEAAEFAIVVQRAYAGLGLGRLLMERLVAEARRRGLREIWGTVFADNGAMLDLVARLGFEQHTVLGDPGIVRVSLAL